MRHERRVLYLLQVDHNHLVRHKTVHNRAMDGIDHRLPRQTV